MIYSCCSQWFLRHRSYACTYLDHELQAMWADFRVCPHTLKLCLPHIYPWHHIRGNMYQALPFLNWESLEMRLFLSVNSLSTSLSWHFSRRAIHHTLASYPGGLGTRLITLLQSLLWLLNNFFLEHLEGMEPECSNPIKLLQKSVSLTVIYPNTLVS